jgi:hypothetical protein
MNVYLVGIGLMVAGLLLFLAWRRRPNTRSVSANNGSVAIGGNNSGSINNKNTQQLHESSGGGHHALLVTAIIVEVLGIATTIWHATHR